MSVSLTSLRIRGRYDSLVRTATRTAISSENPKTATKTAIDSIQFRSHKCARRHVRTEIRRNSQWLF
jgi:hypothetical protein